MSEPEEYPFGETEYHNFDPNQINTPQEVVDVLDWIADENLKQGNQRAADVFRDARTMVNICLVENTDGDDN